jgi:uncharacterized protein YndB with AHSA1/START domain
MSTAATLTERQDIVVDEVFPHTLDVIWKTLTTPELMSRWLPMPATGFKAAAGARFTYQTTPAGEWDGVIHCQVLEVIPNQLLAYAWRGGHVTNVGYGAPLDTVVTFTLTAVDGGTRVMLVHSGFELPRNETALKNMTPGWAKVLRTIGDLASEQD